MTNITNWVGAAMATVLIAGTATADDKIASGKIKSVNAEAKSFVLTDAANQDFTFKFAENLLVNRDGKETKSDLKVGDPVYVCYDKGLLTWTTHYILVQEGKNRNCTLIRGNVKAYDASKKELTFTNDEKKDSTYAMGDALVRFNREDGKIANVTIGELVTIMVDSSFEKQTLRSVMVDRAATN